MSRRFSLAALTLIGLLSGGSALPVRAATTMAMNGQLLVESLKDHSRTLSAPAEVQSGDRLVFLIRYRNVGAAALPHYDFVAPVPRGVRILPDRADMVRVSADGGHSWTRPDSPFRMDGQGHLRPAGDVTPTHVRVRMERPIAPGETGMVAYRGLLL